MEKTIFFISGKGHRGEKKDCCFHASLETFQSLSEGLRWPSLEEKAVSLLQQTDKKHKH